MAFDGITVRCVASELDRLLAGGRVDKIYMPDSDSVVMAVRSQGTNYKVFLSCNPSLPRVHLTYETRENPLTPPTFCMLLRKHLSGGRIIAVRQPGIERVIEIEIESRNELGDTVRFRLITEIMGRHSNIILVNEEGRISDCVRRVDASVSSVRMVLPGMEYEAPPAQDKLSPLEVTEEKIIDTLFECPNEMKTDKYILNMFAGLSPAVAREFVFRGCAATDAVYMELSRTEVLSIAKHMSDTFENIRNEVFSPTAVFDDTGKPMDFSAIDLTQYGNTEKIEVLAEYPDKFYGEREKYSRLAQKSTDITKTVSNLLQRYRKKATLQRQSVDEAEKADYFKLCGDLITANIYRIKKGDKRVVAENFYDNGKETEIPLEGELTPAENAQRYYAKYNKLKNTAAAAEIQLRQSLKDIEYLESVSCAIENCDNIKDLAEIKSELEAEGYIRIKNKGKEKKEKISMPASFISSDGFEILVGKNNRQNDYLTLKLAKNHDIWFHTKTIPGSHTVIVTGKKEVPDSTIEEAAMLAAYHSRARKSGNVPVDYTEIKYVKKPSGAKPGMVIYTDYKTAYVTPDEKKVNEMIK